ncbi:MAG: (d)CMP kinase [Bacteroidales bacterium]|jgi:cytidylate kinase|nr:(d)CMP kinase [Bacteroidales bacterium]
MKKDTDFAGMKKKMIIAVDGYSSCGKSTFAKMIAREMNCIFIDSGAMYRAVTLWCIRKKFVSGSYIDMQSIVEGLESINVDFVMNPETNMYEILLDSENIETQIRSLDVAKYVSEISQIPEVRNRMVEIQRKTGAGRSIVMDGRDIGTVVFPDADIKIFMTASVDIRAQRRYDEFKARGIDIDLDEVRNSIVARDIADENRDISPLRRAGDAIVLDNSRMTLDAQMSWIREIIQKKFDEGRG